MESLSHRIAQDIATKLGYDNDKRDVIAYGLTAIFQMGSIFLISSLIGLLLGVWVESMVVYISIGLLRKATGGAHSQTLYGCMIVTIFIIAIFSIIARYAIPLYYLKNIYILFPILMIVFVFSFIVIFKKAPVDSPNKPIVKIEKIKRLRRNSFITLAIYFIFVMGLPIVSKFDVESLSISMTLCLATLWQVFTLTKSGNDIINVIDAKFR